MTLQNQRKVAIFDLGNVVLDWNIDRISSSLNISMEEQNLLKKELFGHRDWLEIDHGKVSEATVATRVCKRSNLKKALIERALFAAKNSLSPIDETLSLMRELSSNGISMFCLSNMSRETYDHIKGYALFDMFSGIVISGIEGCLKPDDDSFRLIVKRFNIDTSCALFIDDSLANIETAQRLGINAFHFKRSPNCYTEIRRLLL